jgi:hypothetical protein
MSMSTTITHPDLSIKPPPHPHRFDAESERSDGYIMVTPRSEISSWPLETPVLDHSMSTATPSASQLSSSGPSRNAWMGAELDPSDNIAQLANVHFPEIPALEEGNMSHLDFMSLGDGNGEWAREWQHSNGVGVGSDLDGFPPQGAFGMGFGDNRFGNVLSG